MATDGEVTIDCESSRVAVTMSLQKLRDNGCDFGCARVTFGRFGVENKAQTLFENQLEGVPYKWRYDWDPTKGPHVNVELGSGKGRGVREKFAFQFRENMTLVPRPDRLQPAEVFDVHKTMTSVASGLSGGISISDTSPSPESFDSQQLIRHIAENMADIEL